MNDAMGHNTKNYLSPKVESRSSSIAGRGLFVVKPIIADEIILDLSVGEKLIIGEEEANSRYENGFDYMLQIDDGIYIVTVKDLNSEDQGYINHSCKPNCGIKNSLKIIAMRDIAIGEEITVDYAMSESSDYTIECNCGNTHCRKVITGNDWKSKELQKKYKGFFSEYLEKKINESRGILT